MNGVPDLVHKDISDSDIWFFTAASGHPTFT